MHAAMTDGILNAAREWTGDRPNTCPWRAFSQPIVRRVLEAYGYFESGQLAWVVPNPSHKLVQAITHYHRVRGQVRSKQLEQEAEARKRNG